MFRFWKTTPREAGSQTSRRSRRRFVPSISGSASCLEERVVPAGGGQAMNLAALAQALADTRAGQVVTNMFQSILQTNPTASQLVQDVRRLRNGVGVNGLRNILFASAQRQQLLINLNVNVNTSPQALVNSLFTNVLNQSPTPTATAPFVNAINGGMNRQMVVQSFLNTANGTGRTLTFAAGTSPISVGLTGTTSTGVTATTTTSTGTTSGTTATSTASITPISQLSLSQLSLSQFPVSQIAFSPVTTVNSPINASPVSSIPIGNPLVVNSPINGSPIGSPIPGTNLSSIFSVV